MKIKITSNVKKISFDFHPRGSYWTVQVNGDFVRHNSIGNYIISHFSTITGAVTCLQASQVLPKDFDAKTLIGQNDVTIEVNR